MSYDLDALDIKDGDNFTRNELKSRLTQMDVEFNPYETRKGYYVDLYNSEIQNEGNKQKLVSRLIKDTLDYDYSKEVSKKRQRYEEDEPLEMEKMVKRESRNFVPIITTTQTIETISINEPRKEEVKTIKITKKQEEVPLSNMKPIQLLNPTSNISAKPSVTTTKMSLSVKPHFDPNYVTVPRFQQIENVESNDKRSNYQGSNRNSNVQLPNTSDLVNNSYRGSNKSIQGHNNLASQHYMTPRSAYSEVNTESAKFDIPNYDRRSAQFNPGQISKNESQTNLPMVGPFHDVFKAELETIKRLNSSGRFDRSEISERNDLDFINGGKGRIRQNNRATIPSYTRTIQLEPINKLPLFIEKKTELAPGLTIKHIIKFIVAAAATTVFFVGLKYLIDNSHIWVTTNFQGTASTAGDELRDIVKQTINDSGAKVTENYNLLNNNFSNIIDSPSIADTLSSSREAINNINERIEDTTQKIENFKGLISIFTNPIEFLKNLLKLALLNITDNSWQFVKQNFLVIVVVLLMKYLAYQTYKKYMYRKTAQKVFDDVKDRLKTMTDVHSYDTGLIEDHMITQYSKDHNISEENFRSYVYPELKRLRKADYQIKEFETYSNGRNKIAWQWIGY